MGRNVKTVTVSLAGRDLGKVFVLTEMAASKAEKWGARALLALMRGGVTIPDNVVGMGLAGIAVIGVEALGGLDWDLAEPLLDEMFACITFMPDPTKPQVVRALIEDDIEEVKTRLFLRKEILALHVDFFIDAALLTQAREAVAAMQSNSSST